MKCYGFAVFWNFRILKVVLGYKKWSKTAENEDSQRKIVELSNDMSDVFLAFLEMKCDTPTAIYTTMVSWWTAMRGVLYKTTIQLYLIRPKISDESMARFYDINTTICSFFNAWWLPNLPFWWHRNCVMTTEFAVSTFCGNFWPNNVYSYLRF